MTKALNHRLLAARAKLWLTTLIIALACTGYELRGQQSAAGSIEGRVTVDSTGIGWNGELTATMGQESRFTPMVQGRFRFDDLAPGIWHIVLRSTKFYRSAARDVVVGAAQHVIVQINANRQLWWVSMAENDDSPQNAVANTIGTGATDCGQFGPEVQESELVRAIACAQQATRESKTFFVIRHYLVPGGTIFTGNHIWLAEGLVGHGDGVIRRFEYWGSSIHEMYSAVGSPPRPTVNEMACVAPRPEVDVMGGVRFVCSERR